jgi:perosamine synthetase
MNDITAALGRVQLRRLDELNKARRGIATVYSEQLNDLSWLITPLVRDTSSMHLYQVRVPVHERDNFVRHCIESGVSAGVHYKPLTYYKNLFHRAPELSWTPVTNRVWKTLVTLPLFPDMKLGEVEQVIQAVRSFKA